MQAEAVEWYSVQPLRRTIYNRAEAQTAQSRRIAYAATLLRHECRGEGAFGCGFSRMTRKASRLQEARDRRLPLRLDMSGPVRCQT